MASTISKQARRDRQGISPSPPHFRSYCTSVHYHSASSGRVDDSQRHVFALMSSTLGSLKLNSDRDIVSDDEVMMNTSNACRIRGSLKRILLREMNLTLKFPSFFLADKVAP